ncbi:MAG: MFS transporter [Armatimonadetes bacterium]|nr:MFS transporter [Armatimonadota bacterium]MDW8154283.1 MFS transporter [Armatimonadota bacterium]
MAGRARPGLYALGGLGASLLLQTLVLWVYPFYAPPTGDRLLPPGQVGLALALGRLTNAVAEPLVASWSDRLRSPWGRRRPFVVGGAPLLALTFALVWMPSPGQPFISLAGLLCSFFFLFSLVVNPYLAMLTEFWPGRERVLAAVAQAAGNVVGTGIAYTLSAWLVHGSGFPAMGGAFAGAAVLLLWAASLAVQEGGQGGPEPLNRTLAEVLGRPQLRAYLLSLGLAWVGLSLLPPVLVFFATVLMGVALEAVGRVLSLALLSTLCGLPVILTWGKRLGPRRALRRVLAVAVPLLPLVSLIGLVPGIPPLWHGYALIALAGLPLAGLYALPNAVLAEIAAGNGGHEALHFALQGVTLNLANAIAAALSGLLLSLGYAPGEDLGLRLVPLCSAGLLGGALLVFRVLWRE